MADATGSPTFVLTVDAVKWAIETLRRRKIHPHFLAYLQVHRRWAPDERIDPQWAELRPLLEMPGGPPKKPNYRPLWYGNSTGSVFWLNENLAGSFAASSIRTTAGFLVDGRDYVLPENHATLALNSLLYGERIPALALGAYLFRNFGFKVQPDSQVDVPEPTLAELRQRLTYDYGEREAKRDIHPPVDDHFPDVADGWRRIGSGDDLDDPLPAPEDVVRALRRWFQFGDDDEFDQLFDNDEPSVEFAWFEVLPNKGAF